MPCLASGIHPAPLPAPLFALPARAWMTTFDDISRPASAWNPVESMACLKNEAKNDDNRTTGGRHVDDGRTIRRRLEDDRGTIR